MNKKIILGAVSLLVIFAVVLTAGCVDESDKKTYVVGIDVYEPYSWTDENGNIVGFDVDCMKWIAEEEGYDVTFDYIDWDALATYLQTGKRDIICSGLSITPDRKEVIDFSDPYWMISIDVVSLAGKNYTMDQFYNGDLKIGVQTGCSAYEGLEGYLGEELYAQMKKDGKIVDTYSTFPLSMQDLKNGRVDVVIFDSAGIKSHMDNNLGIFERVGTIDGTEEYFAAAVKKGNTELLSKLNDGYAKLMASPYWVELVAKYNLVTAE
ncbi:MAG TPA: transporter substrate-binding domain-containing protein [Methanocorpusculum sp.]|nr:transporter substrate-binding domain-containing protein [Methanocorpusculum sp.]